MEKVVALVVTFNRKQLLSECIDALRNQTRRVDKILVVNNGSTDDTEQWLRTQPDIDFVSQANLGSAGGFGTGLEKSYNEGYSWVWCMDDDGYPAPNALEEMLKNAPHEHSLLNCAVIDKKDKSSFVWRTGNYSKIEDVTEPLIKGICHPFNGTLIHRAIIEKVGFPKRELFIWGEETEYFFRITRKYNIPAYTVSASRHYHPASAYSYKNEWELKNGWKMYFYIRNRFNINLSRFSNRFAATLHYLFFLSAFTGLILMYQKHDRLKKVKFVFMPVTDLIKNDFSANPSSILAKINALEPEKDSLIQVIARALNYYRRPTAAPAS